MVDVKNKPRTEQDDAEALTDLYLKLERLQGYLRRIEGRTKKYELDLDVVRKAREKRDAEALSGLKKDSSASDQTI